MEINIARKIDYWLGIPACFILSLIEKSKRLFRKESAGYIQPKGILFIEFSEMGSAILACPAIKQAKKLYPDAELYFWTFKTNAEAVEILGVIPKENIFIIDPDNFVRLLMDAFSNLVFIRKKRIDTVIDMEIFSRFSGILSYLTGAKFRAGFYKYSLEGLYRGKLSTHRVQYKPYTHISDNFCNLIESLSSDSNDQPLLKKQTRGERLSLPKIGTTSAENNILARLSKENLQIGKDSKIVVINPGFDDRLCIRRWPLEKYSELIGKLTENPRIIVALVGLKPNNPGGNFNSKQCVNLTGKTCINDLLGLFNSSEVFISHDSGTVHLASLTRVNIIVLFGPETPVLYSPLTENKEIIYKDFSCSPCLSAYNHRKSICNNNKCMQEISAEEVYNLIKKVLR